MATELVLRCPCAGSMLPNYVAIILKPFPALLTGVRLLHPTDGFEGDVAGRSFHNGRFVQRLRQAAASVPSLTVRQAMVKRLLNGEANHLAASKVLH